MNNLVLESIIDIRVTKAYVQEHAEIEVKASGANAYRKNNRLVRINALFDPCSAPLSRPRFGYRLRRRRVSRLPPGTHPGQLVSFVVYLGMLGWPMFAWRPGQYHGAGQRLHDRIDNIMSQTPEVKEPAAPVAVGPAFKSSNSGTLRFAYPGSEFPAVENISFTLEKARPWGSSEKPEAGKRRSSGCC